MNEISLVPLNLEKSELYKEFIILDGFYFLSSYGKIISKIVSKIGV